MTYFKRMIYSISNWIEWISVGALTAMTFLICINVVLRQFSRPIIGTEELVGYFALTLISFALASNQIQEGNIAVDILVKRLPQRVQVVILGIGCLLSLGIFSLVTWQMILYGIDSWQIGDLSLVLRIPVFPIIFAVAFCFFLFCIVLLIDFLKSLGLEANK